MGSSELWGEAEDGGEERDDFVCADGKICSILFPSYQARGDSC